jgi:RNA polymerase subunit RPABC4/transcription elongation factor Spt4
LQCENEFDIIKSHIHIDDPENCPACGSALNRRKVTGGIGFFGASDWQGAFFSHALGKVVSSRAEESRIAKAMGMQEVGNEPVDKIHKYYDEQREKELDLNYEKDKDKLKQIIEESRV